MQHAITSQHLQAIQQNTFTTDVLKKENVFHKFIAWCNGQEEKRFLWLAVGFLGDIGAVLPLTILAIFVGAGHNFALLMLVSAVNVPVLALNLAAQSTRVTLPALFFAWLVNALVIIYCAAALLIAYTIG